MNLQQKRHILLPSAVDFSTANLSGLRAWGRADTLVYDGSNLVSEYTDKTGNGYSPVQATGANKPLYISSDSAIGGRPSVEGDGVNSFMLDASFPSTNQPLTIFLVAKRNVIAASTGYYIAGNSANTPQVFSRSVNNGETAAWANAPQLNSGINGDTNYHIIAVVFDGASSKIYIDGVEISGATGTVAMEDIYLFQFSSGVSKLNGRIAEWAITNVANRPAQIVQWTNAMKSYYKLP